MNEENNFSINVNAEIQSLGLDSIGQEEVPSQFTNIQTDVELPERTIPSSMEIDDNRPNIQSTIQEDLQINRNLETSKLDVSVEPDSTSIPQAAEITATVIDPVLMEATQIEPPRNISAQSSGGVNMSVKIQAEDAFKKAEGISHEVQELRQGIQEVQNSIKEPWLPMREKDEFEERPTTEPTNLIFEERRSRMTAYPEWG